MPENESAEISENPVSNNNNSENMEDTQSSQKPREQDLSEKNSAAEETHKIAVRSAEKKGDSKSPPRWRAVIGVLVGLIIFIGLGALGGMQSGIQARQGKEYLDKAVEAVAQFELGRQDLEKGRCAFAQQRFEYVIELNPSFPNIAEKLGQAILCLGVDATATVQITLAPTPTPDTREADEIFSQAESYLTDRNWDGMLPLLDSLRRQYPDYQPIKIDGMYYTALRNRGVGRIIGLGELEGGIFDLNQAEKIGPLDTEAKDYRQWAILYIVGQSFWEVDWGQAVLYFEDIAGIAPNLHDADYFTSEDRLATAKVEYAQDIVESALFIAGGKGWCEAERMMKQAASYSPHSPEFIPTVEWLREKCKLNPEE